jgi:type-F conjugative transfer system pilin assembly protein TrbC
MFIVFSLASSSQAAGTNKTAHCPQTKGESWLNKLKNSGNCIHVKLPKYSITVRKLGKQLKNTVTVKKAEKITGLNKKNEKNLYKKFVALRAYKTFESKSVQGKIAKLEREMLGTGPKAINGGLFAKYIPKKLRKNYIKFLKSGKPFAMQSGKRIFLMISSSVPFKTLRRYVLQVADNNLPVEMILRGLIPGSHDGKLFMPTIKYIEALIKYKGRTGYYDMHVDIDPLVYTKFNVHKVPALIYVRNYNPQTFTSLGEQAYVVYGNANLEYGLKEIESKTKSVYVKRVLASFKKEQFFGN